jgi:branched-chain amino acid transport system permease protein
MTMSQQMLRVSSGTPMRGAAWVVLPLVVVAAAAVPWFATFAVQRLLVEALTLFTVALAWNLLAGYGGLVAVGLHVFVGVGAYALFTLSNQLHLNPWLLLPAAGLFAAFFALISAWPMFRLSGAYFAVGTWVLAEMMRILTLNTPWLGAGAGMPLEAMSGFDRWTRNAGVYWAAVTVGFGALIVARAILRGPLGLALMSVRDSEPAALACGVPVARAKIALWIVGAVMSGLAGAVAYMNTLQVTPDASFSLNWTAAAIFIAVLGGIGTLEGPIVGTIIYFVLREVFAGYGAWYFIGIGLLAIMAMVAAPGGAWSLVPERWRLDPLRVRRRMPEGETPASTVDTEAATLTRSSRRPPSANCRS